MTDRNTAELRQHQAKEDAQEAKWQAYEERAKEILADRFFYSDDPMKKVGVWTLIDAMMDSPANGIIDCGEWTSFIYAVANRDQDELGRIIVKSAEHTAKELAESKTFEHELADIVNQLDEDNRYDT